MGIWQARSRLALLFLGTLFAGSQAGETHQPPGQARNELWRMIFARPVGASVEAPAERVSLGRALFHDPRLSGNGTRSCASCHDPAKGFSNGLARGAGIDGTPMRRNVPGLFNLAWGKSFYWDGRAPSLEDQARAPILAPNEMGGHFSTVIERLAADNSMREAFARAFPDRNDVTEQSIVEVISAYERSLVSGQTRFDLWVNGDGPALSEQETAGFDIFVGKGGCVACHGGWRFTDDSFHDIGLKSDDPGRGAVPGGVPGLKQFKTPGLRELAVTAPYMHDGSLATLRDVVDHYAGDFDKRPSLAANIRRNLSLSEAEKQALVAFLLTLSENVERPQQPGR